MGVRLVFTLILYQFNIYFSLVNSSWLIINSKSTFYLCFLEILPSKESHDELCFNIWRQLESESNTGSNSTSHSIASKHVKSLSAFIKWMQNLQRFSLQALKYFPCEYSNYDEADNTTCCDVFVTGSLYMVGRILKVHFLFTVLKTYHVFVTQSTTDMYTF